MRQFLDRVSLPFSGYDCRVRVTDSGDAPAGYVLGRLRVEGPPPERLLQLVLEMKPEGAGTVDLARLDRSNWRIRASEELGDGFAQRLRNVLVNDHRM